MATVAQKAAIMGIQFEGPRTELYLIHRDAATGARSFVARIKHLRNGTPRANAIVNAIWNNYGGDVAAFIAKAKETSPAHAAGLI